MSISPRMLPCSLQSLFTNSIEWIKRNEKTVPRFEEVIFCFLDCIVDFSFRGLATCLSCTDFTRIERMSSVAKPIIQKSAAIMEPWLQKPLSDMVAEKVFTKIDWSIVVGRTIMLGSLTSQPWLAAISISTKMGQVFAYFTHIQRTLNTRLLFCSCSPACYHARS